MPGRTAERGKGSASGVRVSAPVRRFTLNFLALVALFSALIHIDIEAFDGVTTRWMTRHVAEVVAQTMSLGGADVAHNDDLITYRATTFEVLADCTGVEVIGLFVAAVLAFPARWRDRLAALLAGIPVLLLLNLARMITLIYFGARSATALHYGHLYVWPIILLTTALGIWLQWARSASGDLRLRL